MLQVDINQTGFKKNKIYIYKNSRLSHMYLQPSDVCIWRCEHAVFLLGSSYAPYINFHVKKSLTHLCLYVYK